MRRHLVSLPFSSLRLITISAYRPLDLSPQSDFFSPVRRLQPRNAHHRPRGRRWRESGKDGGRWTSCYICNIFAFTIFQLVCILEPLLFSSTLVLDFFSLSLPSPPSSLYVRIATGGCWTLWLFRLLDHRLHGAIVLFVFSSA